MRPTEKAVVLLTVRIKQRVVFFRRRSPGSLIRPSCVISKDQNVFGTPLQKDLQAGISGRLLKASGGREGQNHLGLGWKVLVPASRRASLSCFSC